MSCEQWADQQHAEALDALKNAQYYALLTVTENGTKLLDGFPGDAGSSPHDQLCAFSMLEGFAKSHRQIIEQQMLAATDNDE